VTGSPYVDALLIGYLFGSIPTGVWLSRLLGVDVLRSGSGNTGATNVARTVGASAGILTLLGDVAKGTVAVLVTSNLSDREGTAECAALAALLGHSYSIFLRGAGGKAVATAGGAFLVLAPAAMAFCIATFAATAYLTRYASLASLAAALSLPLATTYFGSARPTTFAAIAAALFIVFRHRDNLRRLARGTEPKFRHRA